MSRAAYRGQIRIIAGRHRGRKLDVAPGSVRPTLDRVREALFSILDHRQIGAGRGLAGARVLDAFAGTGALGLEALSRNAELALFLEPDREARRVLADNIRTLGEGERGFLLPRDATKPGPMPAQGPFDLVFADAPYGTGLGAQALAAMGREHWFINGALAVLEMAVKETVEPPEGFTIIDERAYGRTRLVLFRADRGRPLPDA